MGTKGSVIEFHAPSTVDLRTLDRMRRPSDQEFEFVRAMARAAAQGIAALTRESEEVSTPDPCE